MRHRKASSPNSCGEAAKGNDKEYSPCNEGTACSNRDCEFEDWGSWEACSTSCDGVAKRSREIKHMGSGSGHFCEGGMDEIKTCNPSATTHGCTALISEDCKYSEWHTPDCPVTCGRDVITKTRKILTPGKYEGEMCDGALTKVEPCTGLSPCKEPEPINCEWTDWSSWGACDGCVGEKKRFRNIAAQPKYGGDICEQANSEEVAGCEDKAMCHTTYCIWSLWEDWGICSKPCGTGLRERRRSLYETGKAPKDDDERLLETYQALQQQMREKSERHWQDVFVAFGAGGFSFVFVGLLLTAVTRLRSRRNTASVYLPFARSSHEETYHHFQPLDPHSTFPEAEDEEAFE